MNPTRQTLERRRRYRRITLWSLALILVMSMALPLGGYLYVGISDARSQPAAGEANPRSQYWRAVREGNEGYTAVPGREMDVLIQPGQNWRQIRNGWIVNYGGWFLFVVALGITAFFLIKGPQRLEEGRSGTEVRRWNVFERLVHWTTATLFVILAITGLSLLFGRAVLIPLMGLNGFSAWAEIAMGLHNTLGPAFSVVVAVMILMWIRRNIPKRHDLTWLAQGGGIFKKAHPDAGFVNAGEKIWFWFICTVGVAVIVSGFVMDFPNWGFTRTEMQTANIVHATLACLWVALWFGHAYIGTIGTEGALEGMTTGYVDENWAKQHHNLWLEKVEAQGAQGDRRAGGTAQGTGSPGGRTGARPGRDGTDRDAVRSRPAFIRIGLP